jgi:hypothetical protein
MEETNRICPWCSTPIPATEKNCPKCGAAFEGAIATEIPGLTVVDPNARLGGENDPIRTDLGHDPWTGAGSAATAGTEPETETVAETAAEELAAVEPPSEAVRVEMRKIALEAEIENAGTVLMNPTGDVSIDAGPPSTEAIEAYKAGLLDATGPAGETDLAELAAPWEDPELEKRVEQWRSEPGEPTDKPK